MQRDSLASSVVTLTSVNKSKVINTANINVFSKNGFDKILCISRCGYRKESNIYNTPSLSVEIHVWLIQLMSFPFKIDW